jgi:flavin-dependent dehydrogenase
MQRSVDVALLGGGLAANLLARQLRRQSPELSVSIFERETKRDWKVGEATVEIAATYLTKRLGLTRYLYERQLPKNGLRFFFDTPERDAPLEKMSEIGLSGLPTYPSFQLDRARLEGDLVEMNRRDGVDVHLGARVKNLALSKDGGDHTFEVAEGETTTAWRARWVVDCMGRNGAIARLEDLRMPEKSHRITAVWGRFENVADMDDWHDREWLRRVRYTARYLSTNHFNYDGQWIWFIPLRDGVISVGVVCEPHMVDKSVYEPEGFLAYLRKHRAPAQLLENAKLLDVQHYTQLAFRTKKFWAGEERWATVGDSAAFSDPFYSPGSDFISIENDMISDMIARSFAGEDVAERSALYDELIKFRYDVTLSLYDQLYETFGSYELFRAKVFFDCACYYNLWFDSYEKDEHLDQKAVEGMLRRKEPVIVAMKNFSKLFKHAAKTLKERGHYHRMNLGIGLTDGMEAFGPIMNVGAKRRRPEIDRRTEEIFNRTAALVNAMLNGEESPYVERPLWAFAEPGADLLAPPPREMTATGS